MKQDIDFLKLEDDTAFKLPAEWITASLLGLIALLALITLWLVGVQIRDHWALSRVQAEHVKTIAKFQTIAKAHPLLASNTPLPTQIEQLKKALAERKQYYVALTRVALRYGFSNYMDALATVTPKGLWLDEILINQTEKTASLSGYMLKPVDISDFLTALQKIGAFSGTTFGLFNVKAVPDTAVIAFTITNKKADLSQ